mmetsp:Transcript_6699/g.24702  ORF Transcript_6699/g.24702 Transcript_6699/m.24702 type:complete len:235 (+) Transcript_6699:770-1474(+)
MEPTRPSRKHAVRVVPENDPPRGIPIAFFPVFVVSNAPLLPVSNDPALPVPPPRDVLHDSRHPVLKSDPRPIPRRPGGAVKRWRVRGGADRQHRRAPREARRRCEDGRDERDDDEVRGVYDVHDQQHRRELPPRRHLHRRRALGRARRRRRRRRRRRARASRDEVQKRTRGDDLRGEPRAAGDPGRDREKLQARLSDRRPAASNQRRRARAEDDRGDDDAPGDAQREARPAERL